MNKKVINKSIASFLETTSFSFHAAKDFIYEIKKTDVSINDLVLSEKAEKQIYQILLEYSNLGKIKKFQWLSPTSKIILEWDSWCWKTSTALAIANSLNKWLVIINLSEIISSKLWETSKNLSQAFKYAEENDYIIFLDEFDSISKTRSDDKELWEMKRVVNWIIQLLDFGSDNLIVIWATNYIENLDSAIRRRFEEVIKFDKPNEDQIRMYIKIIEKSFWNKVFIEDSDEMIKQLLGLDFFRIKILINSSVKRFVISGVKKIRITSKDIIK